MVRFLKRKDRRILADLFSKMVRYYHLEQKTSSSDSSQSTGPINETTLRMSATGPRVTLVHMRTDCPQVRKMELGFSGTSTDWLRISCVSTTSTAPHKQHPPAPPFGSILASKGMKLRVRRAPRGCSVAKRRLVPGGEVFGIALI
jgi:hypothetical protein